MFNDSGGIATTGKAEVPAESLGFIFIRDLTLVHILMLLNYNHLFGFLIKQKNNLTVNFLEGLYKSKKRRTRHERDKVTEFAYLTES